MTRDWNEGGYLNSFRGKNSFHFVTYTEVKNDTMRESILLHIEFQVAYKWHKIHHKGGKRGGESTWIIWNPACKHYDESGQGELKTIIMVWPN